MRALMLLILLGLSVASHAVTVSDLYQVRVAVADQSDKSRQAAVQEALLLQVVKVSGLRSSAQNDTVLSAAAHADRLVKSFRFVRNESNVPLQLEVVFAQNLLDDLLRDAGLPVWGRSRPLILAWLAVEDGRQRVVVGQSAGSWREPVEAAMNERGLPLIWPALDLQDELALPVGQLWGLFRSDINAASERYMADAILAGRISSGASSYSFRGFLKLGQENQDIQLSAASEPELLAQVADQIATFMAKRFSVVSSGAEAGFRIQVSGVDGFRHYQDVLSYLRANVAIKDVRVVGVQGDVLTLELDLTADWDQVWTTLALDRRLLQTEQESVYNWRH